MEDALIKLGAGGLLAIMILREVFSFIKAILPRSKKKKKNEDFSHDDIPSWYVKESIQKKLDDIEHRLKEIEHVLKEQIQ